MKMIVRWLKYTVKTKVEKLRQYMASRAFTALLCRFFSRAAMAVAMMWMCVVYFIQVWPHVWPTGPRVAAPPIREYQSNGYLMVSANGGLNQMRSGICDMAAIAKYMNATLLVPQLDKTSLWQDQSEFKDIFDVDHFIETLKDEVKIVRELPPSVQEQVDMRKHVSIPPVSWSNISYYTHKILPQALKKHGILHFQKTDSRLANNGPLDVQKLRCKVNYEALKFTSPIENMGNKIVKTLRKKGKFLVLHLRYEKDILAFSGCNEGCNNEEVKELESLRYSVPWWKKKNINSTETRLDGQCPLTPEETAVTLKALGIDPKMQIYIAAGDIYGGERRLETLRSTYPNMVKKETLMPASDLLPYKDHSSQMAALDYIVSLESDIFFPTYGGNMAKVVEGHRRYLGFRQTIQPDTKPLVDLIDNYRRNLNWKEFEDGVKKAHRNRFGNPATRRVVPGKPKEDYFWSNPQECLAPK